MATRKKVITALKTASLMVTKSREKRTITDVRKGIEAHKIIYKKNIGKKNVGKRLYHLFYNITNKGQGGFVKLFGQEYNF